MKIQSEEFKLAEPTSGTPIDAEPPSFGSFSLLVGGLEKRERLAPRLIPNELSIRMNQ
jgi:hypothetical protein